MKSVVDLAGALQLKLHYDGRRVAALEIHSTRPLHLTQILKDKTPQQVLTLVPMLYSLCGVAQQVAALRALEQAQGIVVDAQIEQQRTQLVAAETVRELCLSLRRQLSGAASLLPAPAMLQRWFQAVKSSALPLLAVGAGPDNRVAFDAAQDELSAMLAPLQQAQRSLDDGVLALTLSALQQDYGAFELAPPAAPLTGMPQWVAEQLAAPGADRFVRAPERNGTCFETGAWAQQQGSALVAAGRVLGYGTVVLRLLARMAALNSAAELFQGVAAPVAGAVHIGCGDGVGICAVEAARGVLIHRLELAGERVADYRILAPTEWNFHPQGTLAAMLSGVELPLAQVKPLAEMLVQLVDPCVAFKVEVELSDA